MAKRPTTRSSNSAQAKQDAKKAFGATTKRYFKDVEKTQKTISDKADKIREFRREASRKAALANKRIERLERNKLKDSPAYQQYIKDGGGKFGVKGKSYNEVQKEVAKLDRFINSKTSTIKGINKTLKEMASNTGIKYSNLKDLRKKSSKFFELASKVEQYLRTVEDMASAIGYQKIWEAINQYTQDADVDLSSGEADIDSMINSVTKALKTYDNPTKIPGGGWYKLSDTKENK